MTLRALAIATHIVGLILWVGGTASAALVAASVADAAEETRKVAYGAARKAVLFIGTPGVVLTWIAGLSVLLPDFSVLYARAGWMHGKLTVILLLTALTGVLTGRLRRAAKGTAVSATTFSGLAIGLVLGAAIIVFLAILRPGA
ncbi:MAG: CopD family protein [Sandaracinaceae bacterium]|nr:CopD family protein [Sandaracinaceae bacterium]